MRLKIRKGLKKKPSPVHKQLFCQPFFFEKFTRERKTTIPHNAEKQALKSSAG
jgi:hypothetical protein